MSYCHLYRSLIPLFLYMLCFVCCLFVCLLLHLRLYSVQERSLFTAGVIQNKGDAVKTRCIYLVIYGDVSRIMYDCVKSWAQYCKCDLVWPVHHPTESSLFSSLL